MSTAAVEALRSRYGAAQRDLSRARADVSRATTLLSALDAAHAAARRGDAPDSVEETIEALDDEIGDWAYDLGAVPDPDRPTFADFGVESPGDLADVLAEAAAAAAGSDAPEATERYEALRSLLDLAVTGAAGELDDSSERLEHLDEAVAVGDGERAAATIEALVERVDERGVGPDDLARFVDAARGPTDRESLGRLQDDAGRESVLGALAAAVAAPREHDYSEPRSVVTGALRAVDAFAAARRDAVADVTAELADEYPGDPADPLDGVAGETPVLLLPTRLETRFEERSASSGPDFGLEVRVYPDDVHVDTHERELTDEEVRWGVHFWEQVWWANHTGTHGAIRAAVPERLLADVDLEDFPAAAPARHGAVLERAWAQLEERFGPERAAWVKRQLAPATADDLLDGPADDSAPDPDPVDFAAIRDGADRRPDSWTRPPRARGLPDQWIAFAETDGTTVTARSNPVRRPLAVGPDPDQIGSMAETADAEADDAADAGPGDADRDALGEGETSWVFDYDEAVDAGMALTLGLSADQVAAGVDRLVVLGVSTALDERDGANAVSDLLTAHRYTDGLSFVERGTPTNDTREDSAGTASGDEPSAFELACGDARTAPGPESDAARAARLLGLTDPSGPASAAEAALGRVAGARAGRDAAAEAMNAALWPATWGYYLPHMLAPERWTDAVRPRPEFLRWLESYRRHFVAYVRAGGPLPAVRVGDQPYGILPTTDLSDWQSVDAYETTPGPDLPARAGAFTYERLEARDAESDLVSRLGAVRDAWTDAVDAVPSIESPDDPEPVVADLLGMAGTSYGYRLRSLLGDGVITDLLGPSTAVSNAIENASNRVTADLQRHVPNAEAPRVGELLTVGAAPELRAALVADDLDAYLRSLRTEPHGALRAGPPGSGLSLEEVGNVVVWLLLLLLDADDDSLLEVLLYVAVLEEYRLARVRLGHHYDDFSMAEEYDDWSDTPWALFPEPETYDDGDPTLWRALDDPVDDSLTDHPRVDGGTSYGDLLRAVPEFDGAFATVVDAMESLESIDESLAERLLRETLDLSSHRFDAWATSVATRRLDGMRSAGGEGLYVGAYGYVENLEREPGSQSAGYIQAPSVGQATTAAVLRSGFETDAGEALAVDLSAARVRDATGLIDAVRDGQPLGELLGYRFERRLREEYESLDLARYIPAVRSLAPLVEGKVDRQGMTASDRVAERDVVDGVAIVDLWREGAIPWGQAAGSHGTTLPSTDPADDSFDACEAIRTELASLESSLDAVSDVLTAESVHQLVSGNPERAGGSLDALSRGEAPPDLAVTETPRTGTACTHRLLALLDPEGSTWGPGDAPRAVAEPALNAWAGTLLGDPSRVVCRVAFRPRPAAVVTDTGGDAGDTGGGDADGAPGTPEWRVTTVRLADLELCPLDLVYLVEGDAEAWASELEERIDYRVRRSRSDVAPDGETRISFAPPTEWPDPAALGVDPEADVGFGPLLEAVRAVRETVTSARPADARDVALPGEAGDRGLQRGPLETRAETVQPGLADAVAGMDDLTAAFAGPDPEGAAAAVDGATETPPSEYDRLDALTDALGSVAGGSPTRVERRAAVVDPAAAGVDLAALVAVADGDAVAFARDESGDVVVDAREQVVAGLTVARPRTEVDLAAVVAGDQFDFEASVGRDGTFEARLPADARDELGPGDEFDLVATVDGATTTVTARLDDFEGDPTFVGRALAAAAELAAALDALDGETDDVTAALDALDGAVLRAAADRITAAQWPAADAPAHLDTVLDVGAVTLPGLTAPDGWDELGDLLLAVAEGRLSRETLDGSGVAGLPRAERRLAGLVADLVDDVDDGVDDLRDAVDAAATDPAGAFAVGGCDALRARLFVAADHGVHGSVPVSPVGATSDAIAALVRQADSVADECAERLEAAAAAGVDAAGQRERIEALFEDAFEVLPPFAATNPGELDAALAPAHESTLLGPDALAAETWFQRVGRIRDVPRDLGEALTYGESLGDLSPADGSRFRVAQLPYEDPDTWVGRPEAWDGDPPTGKVSLVAHVRGDPSATGLVGLFVDEFVETVPGETETTGVSVHYDKPGNRAPQSMLLAVPPTDADWSLRTLADLVVESVDLAKERTVDRGALSGAGHLLPGTMLATNESSGPGPDTASVDAEDLGPPWWASDGGDA